ncbi:GT4_PimA-like domain containing protein [Candidatus Nanopelagicaceae bacterium]
MRTIKNLFQKITNRMRRVLQFVGIGCPVRQIVFFENKTGSSKKLLIVASGNVTIPPSGWGAVETVISETIPVYLSAGFEVTVLNSKAIQDLLKVKRIGPDIILVHDDFSTKKVRNLFRGTPIVSVTHYGLAAFEDLWHRSYKATLNKIDSANYVICLNSRIREQLSKYIHSHKLLISSNGSSFQTAFRDDSTEELICVGKVEPRKRQFELFRELSNSGIRCRFIGEIFDDRVRLLLQESPEARNSFLGPWTRGQLAQQLPNFKALILISKGEADALVLYEAQLAGLPILVTPNSIGSQDEGLDWIRVIPEHPTAETIMRELSEVKSSRHEIRNWAIKNYRWPTRNLPLTELLLRECAMK